MRNHSRRNVIAAGMGLLALSIAGCTRALQGRQEATSTSTSTGTSTSAATSATTAERAAPRVLRTTAAPSKPGSPTTAPPTSSVSIQSPARTTGAPASAPHTGATTASPPQQHRTVAARQIAHGPRNKPRLALTFHGAGDVTYAQQILEIAAAKKAHITVMAVGTWLQTNPDIGRQILAAGHELGNHTLSHLDINSMSPRDMRAEVIGCRDLLLRTTGTPGSYFRQSQSPTASGQLLTIAGQAGYPVVLSYDLDSMDWQDPGADVVRSNMQAAGPGSIVSMHLGHAGTVQALPAVLDDLRARGLSAVTVTTLLAG